MKKNLYKILLVSITLIFIGINASFAQNYIVIAWNDLGMHCANQDFSTLCVLPPYNNLYAQVVKVAGTGGGEDDPELVTGQITVKYEVPGNTYSVGKTNFWTYAKQLFGVQLQDNIGLKGKGLTGSMDANTNYFVAEGIPITPYTDANLTVEDPFQLATVTVFNSNNVKIATTQNVIPVSNELTCIQSGCHSSEQQMLDFHNTLSGTNIVDKPVLCASCHSSNALGTPGTTGVKSLSEAMHGKHGDFTDNCYNCHPGPKTQCYRDTMSMRGFVCQTCHGSAKNVATTIANGRKPWLEEPRCGDSKCHGSNFSEQSGKLFRQSKGHGGLYCSACHGSPHAVVPSRVARDNQQNIALQGMSGTLRDCRVCHGKYPDEAGPHGIMAQGQSTDTQAPDPHWTMGDDGSVSDGNTADKPDDPNKRSNLGMVLYHRDESYNDTFTTDSITPGVSSSTKWSWKPNDKTMDAKGRVEFQDMRKNDTIITLQYWASDIYSKDQTVDLGVEQVNGTASKDITIYHKSPNASHTISDISLQNGNADFTLDLNGKSLPYDIGPNDSLKITVNSKSHSQEGTFKDNLIINYTKNRQTIIPVTATFTTGHISITGIDFGTVPISKTISKEFTINNIGTVDIIINKFKGPTNVVFIPALPYHDSYSNFTPPLTISPNSSLKFTVSFTPSEQKDYIDSIIFYNDAMTQTYVTKFTGSGLAPTPEIIISSIDFGTCEVNKTSFKDFTITNPRTTDIVINRFRGPKNSEFIATLPPHDANGKFNTPIKISPQSSITYAVLFTPKEDKTYIDSIVFYNDVLSDDYVTKFTGKGQIINDVVEPVNSKLPVIDIIPEPVSGLSIISLSEINGNNISVIIFDENGDIVRKFAIDNIAGRTEIPFDTYELASGAYYVKVSANGMYAMKKFMIIK